MFLKEGTKKEGGREGKGEEKMGRKRKKGEKKGREGERKVTEWGICLFLNLGLATPLVDCHVCSGGASNVAKGLKSWLAPELYKLFYEAVKFTIKSTLCNLSISKYKLLLTLTITRHRN